MRLIIAGGRNYRLTPDDFARLNAIHLQHAITTVLSGHARGADADGEAFAHANGIPLELYPADWTRLGKGAGPIRNCVMARKADALAVFPGGNGTAHMLSEAKKVGLTIFDFTGQEATQ